MYTDNQIMDVFKNQLKRPATPFELNSLKTAPPVKMATLKDTYAKLNPNSLSDYLTSIGQDNSLPARTALGQKYGITNVGTPEGNTALLNALKGGQAPTPAPVQGSISPVQPSLPQEQAIQSPTAQPTATAPLNGSQTPEDFNKGTTEFQGSVQKAAETSQPQTLETDQTYVKAKTAETEALKSYQDYQKQVADVDTQIRNLRNVISGALKDKEAQAAASGGVVSRSQIAAEVAGQTQGIQEQINALLQQRAPLATAQSQYATQLQQARKDVTDAQNNYYKNQNLALAQAKQTEATRQFEEKQALAETKAQTQEEQFATRTGIQYEQFQQKLAQAEKLADAKMALQSNTILKPDQVQAIGDAIISGEQSPIMTGLYRSAAPVKAYLASKGFDLAKAEQDFKATTKYLSTLNGSQFLRQKNAVAFVRETIPSVKSAIEEWNTQVGAGKYPLLNKANLLAAQQGVYGTDAQVAATNFNTWLTDLASELSTVYRGGNSPTDQTLKQANSTLSQDWSLQSLNAALDIIDKTTGFRMNAINATSPIGIGSEYLPTSETYSTSTGNNPLNITLGSATQKWVDSGDAVVKEAKGRKFLEFKDPQVGLKANKELLFGPSYSGLTLNEAMKKWSGGDYDASDKVISSSGIKPDVKMSSLTPVQQDSLVRKMAQREGGTVPPPSSGGDYNAYLKAIGQ